MKKILMALLMVSSSAFAGTEVISIHKRAFANNDRTARKAAVAAREKAVKELVADCESDQGVASVELGRVQLLTLNRARVMATASAKVSCTK